MEKYQMKNFKSASIATLVAICFFFVAFATQPAEAVSHHSKAGISAPVKHKKVVKKTKKAKKAKKVKKSKKTSAKSKRQFSSADPAAQ